MPNVSEHQQRGAEKSGKVHQGYQKTSAKRKERERDGRNKIGKKLRSHSQGNEERRGGG